MHPGKIESKNGTTPENAPKPDFRGGERHLLKRPYIHKRHGQIARRAQCRFMRNRCALPGQIAKGPNFD